MFINIFEAIKNLHNKTEDTNTKLIINQHTSRLFLQVALLVKIQNLLREILLFKNVILQIMLKYKL